MIAGPPDICDQIPLFTKKSVLVSYEASHAIYFKNYWRNMRERTYGFWKAYLTSDPNDIIKLIEMYNIDYIILDKFFYNNLLSEFNKKNFYFEPFDSYIRTTLNTKGIGSYYLLKMEIDYGIKINNRFSLIKCGSFITHHKIPSRLDR